jgi:AcrR family transcriptional regulator
MGRPRLSSADRRDAILTVALRVFAEHGFDKTKVEWIAQQSDISQALIYRHFPTKSHLYRGVLRRVLEGQDRAFVAFGQLEPSGQGLARLVAQRLVISIAARNNAAENGARLVLRSIAGDGSLARLIYRRVKRKSLPALSATLATAVAVGDIQGDLLPAENIIAFIEHVAATMQVARTTEPPVIDYAGDDHALLHNSIVFCARGIGLRPALVELATQIGRELLEAQQNG